MQKILSTKDISWADIEHPSSEELAEFARTTNIMPSDMEYITEDHHIPDLTAREDYTLFLMHIPVFDKQLRITSGVPLFIIVTDTHVWTIHNEPIVTLEKIYQDIERVPEKYEEYFEGTPLSLALYILEHLGASSIRKINRLAKHIDIAEDAVFQGNERKMVREVAVLSRDVLDFYKIIHPQMTLFSARIDLGTPFARAQWQRLYRQTEQMSQLLETLYQSVKELRQTNDALLQHKQNELLRTLTIYSIIAIPMWIFVSPFNPRDEMSTIYDHVFFWGTLIVLVMTLVGIFVSSKQRRVL